MPDYRVRVEIDVEADTPLAAALDAEEALRELEIPWAVEVAEVSAANHAARCDRKRHLCWTSFDLAVYADPNIDVLTSEERRHLRRDNNEKE